MMSPKLEQRAKKMMADKTAFTPVLMLLFFTWLIVLFMFLSFFAPALVMSPVEKTGNMNWNLGNEMHWMGLELLPLTPDIRFELNIPRSVNGVFVQGTGEFNDLRSGDIILAINRIPLTDEQSFVQAVKNIGYFEGAMLDIYRGGRFFYITIQRSYAYGPKYGPYINQWQLGQPLNEPVLPIGPMLMPRQNR